MHFRCSILMTCIALSLYENRSENPVNLMRENLNTKITKAALLTMDNYWYMSLYYITLYLPFLTKSLSVIILFIKYILHRDVYLMTKQQLLVKVLEKLYDKRELARSFVVIVQDTDDEELQHNLIQLIITLLQKAQAIVKNTKDRDQLIQTQKLLQQIHSQENKAIDEQEAEDLLATLD